MSASDATVCPSPVLDMPEPVTSYPYAASAAAALLQFLCGSHSHRAVRAVLPWSTCHAPRPRHPSYALKHSRLLLGGQCHARRPSSLTQPTQLIGDPPQLAVDGEPPPPPQLRHRALSTARYAHRQSGAEHTGHVHEAISSPTVLTGVKAAVAPPGHSQPRCRPRPGPASPAHAPIGNGCAASSPQSRPPYHRHRRCAAATRPQTADDARGHRRGGPPRLLTAEGSKTTRPLRRPCRPPPQIGHGLRRGAQTGTVAPQSPFLFGERSAPIACALPQHALADPDLHR